LRAPDFILTIAATSFYEWELLQTCVSVTNQPQNNPGYGMNERGCSSANSDKKLDF